MIKIKLNLSKQLIIITSLSFLIMIVSLIIVLPRSLEPFFEDTVYSYLEQPLEVFNGNNNENQKMNNIAYIQYLNDDIYVTNNYKEILKIDSYEKILENIKFRRGKFSYKGKVYYYLVSGRSNNRKIAITTDKYITILRDRVLMIIIPLVVITFSLVLILLLLWSNLLVIKIERLKTKINNITAPGYKTSNSRLELDDELKLLDDTIDRMNQIILSDEKYRREMYQNISHDFKTPIMVVKSYAEAYKDGVENADTVIKISEEEMNKLEIKVKTLLEYNKITYLQNSYKNDKTIEVFNVINDCATKFKNVDKNIKIEVKCDKKKILYNGTQEIWESITNNILNNAIRYAKSKILVTIKNDKIIFFNDGDNIDPNTIKDIFLPYRKGKKGENGLGLSIVKGNCDLLEYKIMVNNKKNGVEFIITK